MASLWRVGDYFLPNGIEARMMSLDKLYGVWFVYDGECPLCNKAAHALRIRQALGALHLLDARTNPAHPLIVAINERQLDLDEGMVIYHAGAFHHGERALHFMAVHGGKKGFFNQVNRLFFQSDMLSKFFYPPMRSLRNLLLLFRGKKPIKNLVPKNVPIFEDVFGSDWEKLPPVMKAHYANRPYSTDAFRAEGMMEVWAAPMLRLFAPITDLLRWIPVTNAKNIPVTVDFESDGQSNYLHFIRTFHFKKGKPYIFHSRMMPQGENHIAERMKLSACWRVAFSWNNGKVRLKHKGYGICLFGKVLPLPLSWLFGSVNAEEWPTGNSNFAMCVEIRHWLFGKIYEYKGSFKMVSMHD